MLLTHSHALAQMLHALGNRCPFPVRAAHVGEKRLHSRVRTRKHTRACSAQAWSTLLPPDEKSTWKREDGGKEPAHCSTPSPGQRPGVLHVLASSGTDAVATGLEKATFHQGEPCTGEGRAPVPVGNDVLPPMGRRQPFWGDEAALCQPRSPGATASADTMPGSPYPLTQPKTRTRGTVASQHGARARGEAP